MGLLRLRDFRLILLSTGLSAMGDELALIALVIRMNELTHSGLWVSALLVCGLVPLVVFSPLAGLLVDRLETVRVLAVSSFLQAGVAVALAFTLHSVVAILVLSFLLGIGACIAQPALFALVPKAAGEDRLTEANGLLEASRYAGAIVGPLFAGGLTAGLGVQVALLMDAATFLVIGFAAAALRVRRPPEDVEPSETRREEARAGFAVFSEDRLLRLTVMVVASFALFAAIDNVAEVFFAIDVLDAGNLAYAGLAAAWMAGMVIGATWVARRIQSEHLSLAVFVSAAVGGGAVGIAALFPSLPLALAGFFVGGVANGVLNVCVRSLMHLRVPDHLRGRAFAAYYAVVMTMQIGATAVGGAVVAGLDATGALLLAGFGGAAAGLLGLILLPRVRSAPPIHEPADPTRSFPRRWRVKRERWSRPGGSDRPRRRAI